MILPSKLYEILKWLALLFLPTVGWAYKALSTVDWDGWSLAFGDQVLTTCSILGTLVGVLIGVSHLNLNNQPEPGALHGDTKTLGIDIEVPSLEEDEAGQ